MSSLNESSKQGIREGVVARKIACPALLFVNAMAATVQTLFERALQTRTLMNNMFIAQLIINVSVETRITH